MYPLPDRRTFSKGLIRGGGMILALLNCRADSKQTDSKNGKAETEEDVYEPGGDVKPPKLIHYVEPNFSSSSNEAFVEGVVKISAVITKDGDPTKLKVTSGLNTEEDKTAMEAVKQWRFTPGTKKGEPVKVRVTVEVMFHLL